MDHYAQMRRAKLSKKPTFHELLLDEISRNEDPRRRSLLACLEDLVASRDLTPDEAHRAALLLTVARAQFQCVKDVEKQLRVCNTPVTNDPASTFAPNRKYRPVEFTSFQALCDKGLSQPAAYDILCSEFATDPSSRLDPEKFSSFVVCFRNWRRSLRTQIKLPKNTK